MTKLAGVPEHARSVVRKTTHGLILTYALAAFAVLALLVLLVAAFGNARGRNAGRVHPTEAA